MYQMNILQTRPGMHYSRFYSHLFQYHIIIAAFRHTPTCTYRYSSMRDLVQSFKRVLHTTPSLLSVFVAILDLLARFKAYILISTFHLGS